MITHNSQVRSELHIISKRDKNKRLQVVITEEQDSLLVRTAYNLSNPERLVSKSEVVRLGIELINQAGERGDLDPGVLQSIGIEKE